MRKAKDLRDHSIEELESSVIETRRALFEIKNDARQTKKLEKPHILRQTKKEVARLLTVIREKQLANSEKSLT